ncbi:MAG TPA: pyruvate dehydrogenase (acetyl-transferring) E1 component subunit alpha [Candidatus Binataceae bacterium]|jgi:pyruvate dehydrogenase E1 component alpha subunit|nr:pyruvate dehydrogenase (acetyl-transferring) E1 component subunit alpha [Candidatus Binataceae bacterium]
MALERERIAERAMYRLAEDELLEIYRLMSLIRRFEDKVAEMYTRGKITGFCHLYAGEEAVAVGAIHGLFDKDYVVSTYREHGHCLAKGASPRVVMAELFGKATGISKGRGGSMHLFDPALRFMGGYAIVGGGLPIATGLGLSIAYRGDPEVVCCFFGDGALPQGAFHESLNMASLWKLPVIFVCENNFYGMGTLVQNAICQEELYRFADPYKIPGIRVDGMDVVEVYAAVSEAAARAREGKGPSLIEAITYRFRGHSMSDPAEYRSKREERIWQERDPIKRYRNLLMHERRILPAVLDRIDQEESALVDDAVKFADESPEPPLSELTKNVYVE